MLTPKDIVKQLKPCHYKYNDVLPLGEKVHFGFIAQDLLESFGTDYNFVTTDKNTGFHMVNYNEFISVLVSVVKEQQAEIEEMKQRLNDLQPN